MVADLRRTVAAAMNGRLALAIPCLPFLLIVGCAWPMYRGGQTRSARSGVDTSGNNGILQWSVPPPPGTAGFWSPVVGYRAATGGSIFAGSSREGLASGALYSVTPTGTIAWTLPFPGDVITGAVGFDGSVYVENLNNGALVAVSPSGTVNWTFSPPSGGSITTDPAIASDGTIYIGDTCGVCFTR